MVILSGSPSLLQLYFDAIRSKDQAQTDISRNDKLFTRNWVTSEDPSECSNTHGM